MTKTTKNLDFHTLWMTKAMENLDLHALWLAITQNLDLHALWLTKAIQNLDLHALWLAKTTQNLDLHALWLTKAIQNLDLDALWPKLQRLDLTARRPTRTDHVAPDCIHPDKRCRDSTCRHSNKRTARRPTILAQPIKKSRSAWTPTKPTESRLCMYSDRVYRDSICIYSLVPLCSIILHGLHDVDPKSCSKNRTLSERWTLWAPLSTAVKIQLR